tara:strand:- start:5353 stop:6576 length:1224 start_codon:yes stop_codon:yes gene_type:complete
MFKTYQIISFFLIPIIVINIFFRIIINKEDNKRFIERFGNSTIKKNKERKVLWIHAASVGEFKSSNLIIERYYKKFEILVTTTTKSSAVYINEFYKDKVIHQYIPFDISIWCSKFLSFWKPSLILWIESDIWPNMLKKIKDQNINCLYLNARISPNSYKKWKYAKSFYSNSLKSFNKIFAQSKNDKERIKQLTKLDIKYIGNLKLARNLDSSHSITNNKLQTITIASTHLNEEELIINNIKKTIKEYNLKIFIAPRHPDRINSIKNNLSKYGFKVSVDSELTNADYDIVIIDGFGKLDKYFKLSNLVILGGSFIKNIGGHNPLEPASYGCGIITGKYVDNWTNIYEDMLKENSCLILSKFEEIDLRMKELINNNSKLQKLQNNAFKYSKKSFFEIDVLFQDIDKFIN